MYRYKPLMVLALLLASAGASYAATGAYFSPDKHQYIVLADAREVVRDSASGTVARTTNGQCVRTKWMTNHDECKTEAALPPPPVEVRNRTAASLSREERTVYFGFNQASLSPGMKERLDSLADVLRSEKQVKGARIVGYADRIGDTVYNEKLSKKRAESVRNYLSGRGFINTSVADVRWLGERSPAAECEDDLPRPQLIDCLQQDRRVEVEIDFLPDVQASR